MGAFRTTRNKIAAGQAVKYAEAIRLLDSACTTSRSGKGSHRVYLIGSDTLTLSKPKGDQLHRYQVKAIDQWLNRHGK